MHVCEIDTNDPDDILKCSTYTCICILLCLANSYTEAHSTLYLYAYYVVLPREPFPTLKSSRGKDIKLLLLLSSEMSRFWRGIGNCNCNLLFIKMFMVVFPKASWSFAPTCGRESMQVRPLEQSDATSSTYDIVNEFNDDGRKLYLSVWRTQTDQHRWCVIDLINSCSLLDPPPPFARETGRLASQYCAQYG